MTVKFVSRFVSRLGLFGELLSFMWHRKLWWLIPLVVVLVIISVLVVAGSTIAPFIYPLF